LAAFSGSASDRRKKRSPYGSPLVPVLPQSPEIFQEIEELKHAAVH
jgi:hypothetical protein